MSAFGVGSVSVAESNKSYMGCGVSCAPSITRTDRLSEKVTLAAINFLKTCVSDLCDFTCYVVEIISNNQITQFFWTGIKSCGKSVISFTENFFTTIYEYVPTNWTWNTVIAPTGNLLKNIFSTYVWTPVLKPIVRKIWSIHLPEGTGKKMVLAGDRVFIPLFDHILVPIFNHILSPVWNRVACPIGNWTIVPIAKQVGGVANGVLISLFGAQARYVPRKEIGDQENPLSFQEIRVQLRAIDPKRENIKELHIYHNTFQQGEEATLRISAERLRIENLEFHFTAKILPS